MQKKNYYLESVLDLNSGNVWGVDAQEILELWQKDIKEEVFTILGMQNEARKKAEILRRNYPDSKWAKMADELEKKD